MPRWLCLKSGLSIYHKILSFWTPKTVTIIGLKAEQFGFTMQLTHQLPRDNECDTEQQMLLKSVSSHKD